MLLLSQMILADDSLIPKIKFNLSWDLVKKASSFFNQGRYQE